MNFQRDFSGKTLGMENISMNNIVPKKNIKKDCDICAELLNKSTRKEVICPFETCSKSSCRSCFIRYVKDCGVNPVCMWCNKELSLEIIESNITQKAYKEYLDIRHNIVFERVKGELPTLQDRASTIIRHRKYQEAYTTKSGEICELNSQSTAIKLKLNKLYMDLKLTSGKSTPFTGCQIFPPWNVWLMTHRCKLCHKDLRGGASITCSVCLIEKCNNCYDMCMVANDRKCFGCDTIEFNGNPLYIKSGVYNRYFKEKKRKVSTYTDELKALLLNAIKAKFVLNEKYTAICIYLQTIRDFGGDERGDTDEEKSVKKIHFVKKCPASGCTGFLSSKLKCGICSKNFCVDCNKEKTFGSDHVCDENEKATLIALKKDTKPCPKCRMPISKIDGCSQMWTPCCKIGFYWDTGKIVGAAERIHSPEYFAYLRRNGGVIAREVGDEVGNVCDARVTYPQLLTSVPDFNKIDKYFRLYTHVLDGELPTLPREIGITDNSGLGISYLVGDISEENWRDRLKRAIKKEEKNHNIYKVLKMFTDIMNIFFKNIIVDGNENILITNADNLITYTNQQLQNVNNRYKSKDKKYFLRLLD